MISQRCRVVIITACAVSACRRLADRPACPVVGIILRWGSAADNAAMRHMNRGQLPHWSRRRHGARLRLEEPCLKVAGQYLGDFIGSWRLSIVVGAMWLEEFGGDVVLATLAPRPVAASVRCLPFSLGVVGRSPLDGVARHMNMVQRPLRGPLHPAVPPCARLGGQRAHNARFRGRLAVQSAGS